MKLLHSNVWWSDGVKLLKNGFTHAQGLNLLGKVLNALMTFWIVVKIIFFTLEQAREKFQLTYSEE